MFEDQMLVWITGTCIALCLWSVRKARRTLDDWAGQNGYRLLAAKQVFFPSSIKRSSVVFLVTVINDFEETRTGTVIIGNALMGEGNSVEVRWTD
jgi:hypothetical protein